MDHAGYARNWSKPKVIRYRMYNVQTEPQQFNRELLMLYYPWRNKEEEVVNADCEALFSRHREEIMQNREKYHYFTNSVLEDAMEQAQNDAQARGRKSEMDPSAATFDFDNYYFDEQEVVHVKDQQYERIQYAENFQLPNQMSYEEFENMLSSLKSEQKDYVMHIAAHFKCCNELIYYFITGEAEVGKSVLISVIYQYLFRIFSQCLELNPDFPSVLLAASTGKVAFNIKGLNTPFQLPVNSNTLTEPSADVSNTMATRLQCLQMIIIEEISMVEEPMLRMVDMRLRHLFGDADFGGRSVIAVGDFRQLRPVMAAPVYGNTSRNAFVEVFGRPLCPSFQVYKLHTVMRQNELEFKHALKIRRMDTYSSGFSTFPISYFLGNSSRSPKSQICPSVSQECGSGPVE